MTFEFETVDVFTDRQFGGNPLAVVVDAKGLSTAQMQSIAAEFNLAETTFVLPPASPENMAQVRIFTPVDEMPFAGHPNVGTAFVLARRAVREGRPIDAAFLTFEEGAGLVRMELLRDGGSVVGARLTSPQPFEIGTTVPSDIVAEACGLAVDDIETTHHEPVVASCGAAFVIAELKDCEVLSRVVPRADAFNDRLLPDQAVGVHLYAPAIPQEVDIQTRMFSMLQSIVEDPATGSANVALIGLLAHLDDDPVAGMEKRIGQGYHMGRPSVLDAAADRNDDGTIATYIGGRCVPVMRGVLDVA